MRFARFGPVGLEVPAIWWDSAWLDLRPVTPDIDGRFLESLDAEALGRKAASGRLPELSDAVSLRVGAPVARPGAVYCIGLNYAAHARESGAPLPIEPVMFMKAPNTVVGPFDSVTIPRGSQRTDWEVELALVVGKQASYLDSVEAARGHIAGFALANDLSEREFQLERGGGQWSKGKSCPGFTPLGPWLVTPDEVDASALRLRSFVNGAPRQDSSTADLIFQPDFIVWHLSQFLCLDPGDVILTGTPEGVALSGRFPYLAGGDVVELEAAGLGRSRQEMIAWARQ